MRAVFAILCACLLAVANPLSLLGQAAAADFPVPSKLNGQTISFTRYIEELASGGPNDHTLALRNITILYDHQLDQNTGMDYWWEHGGHPIITQSRSTSQYELVFDSEYWLVIRDITFSSYFAIVNSSGLKFLVKDCVFNGGVRFTGNEIAFLSFENCHFKNGFKFERNSLSDRIEFKNCVFEFKNELGDGGLDAVNTLIQITGKNDAIDLRFDNCRFIAPSDSTMRPAYFVNLAGSSFSNLLIAGNTFQTPLNLSQAIVQNQFSLQQNTFTQGFLTSGLSINQLNAIVDWEDISNYKLCIYQKDSNTYYSGNSTFGANRTTEYSLLASCYANFYNTFKSQGNRFSSNDSYIELKKIETRQQRQLFEETGDKDAYFIWLMDVFLEKFSDYGTNPIKSISYSVNVILLFALIYFLAPVQLDETPRRSLYSQLNLYASFLASRRPMEDLYKEHVAMFNDTEAEDPHRKSLREQSRNLPWVFRIFTPWRLGSQRIFERLEGRFYHVLDRKGDMTFEEMKGNKKWTVGIVFWLVAFLSAIYFLALKALDSLVLSLNVFSTLGFGEIRVKGIAVYLTILEGFVGWFLLSIFSVVLLNQLLQ